MNSNEDIMTYDINLPRFQQARIWIDDLPACRLGDDIAHRTSIPAQNHEWLLSAAIAVEWLVPGPMCKYALLGARFAPADDAQLQVIVHCGAPETKYADTIASSVTEDVRIGLLSEYAAAVVTGISSACADPSTTRPGTITIETGAHGLVGSCDYIFHRFGLVLGQLTKYPGPPSAEVIGDLLSNSRTV